MSIPIIFAIFPMKEKQQQIIKFLEFLELFLISKNHFQYQRVYQDCNQ